jgi:hypothetical protein
VGRGLTELHLFRVCYPACFHTGAPETDHAAWFPAGASLLGQPCTWSEECEPDLVCAGTAAAPFETLAASGACAAVCDPSGDDCGDETICAEHQGAGYGACAPAA